MAKAIQTFPLHSELMNLASISSSGPFPELLELHALFLKKKKKNQNYALQVIHVAACHIPSSKLPLWYISSKVKRFLFWFPFSLVYEQLNTTRHEIGLSELKSNA